MACVMNVLPGPREEERDEFDLVRSNRTTRPSCRLTATARSCLVQQYRRLFVHQPTLRVVYGRKLPLCVLGRLTGAK